MKRFWKHATVRSLAAGGFRVLLDGKALCLPGGAELAVAALPLAEAIVAEWNAAGTGEGAEVSWNDLPLTRLAGTAQERVAPDPAPAVQAILRYGGGDLLCYWAEEPESLVARQARDWRPWLSWLERRHGVRLVTTAGVAPVAQPPEALVRLAAVVEALPPATLAALGVAVPLLGSVVLGLALAESALGAAEAFRLATLDEAFQAERWGRDALAESRRREMATELGEVERFLALVWT